MDKPIEHLLHGSKYKQLLENRISTIREKYDLRKVDVEVLYYLSKCGGKNTSRDIREESPLTKSHISQSVDRLQKMQLLTMVPDAEDRRCVHLSLTPQAHHIVAEINDVWSDLRQILFAGISQEELLVLNQVAAKISANIEHALHTMKKDESP